MENGQRVEARDKRQPGHEWRSATFLGDAPPLRWRDTSNGEIISIPRVRVRFADGWEEAVDALGVRTK